MAAHTPFFTAKPRAVVPVPKLTAATLAQVLYTELVGQAVLPLASTQVTEQPLQKLGTHCALGQLAGALAPVQGLVTHLTGVLPSGQALRQVRTPAAVVY